MTASPIETALRRVAPLAVVPCLEPPQAFTVTVQGGLAMACSDAKTGSPEITTRGDANVMVVGYGADTRRLLSIDIVGDRNVVYFGPYSRLANVTVSVRGSDTLIYVGSFVTGNKVDLIVTGDGATLAIGDRSMLSTQIRFGRSEHIAIFDRTNGRSIDRSGDILVGDTCWIGRNVNMTPGTTLGSHSVVAQSAIVSGEFPDHCIVGGMPAAILRTDIDWARTNDDTLAEARSSRLVQVLYEGPLAKLQAHNARLAVDQPRPV